MQVINDHGLLRERVARLTGPPGLARLDAALTLAREADPYDPSSASETSSASGAEGASPQKKPTSGEGIQRGGTGGTGAATSTSTGENDADAHQRQPKPRGGIARGFFNSAHHRHVGLTSVRPAPSLSATPTPSSTRIGLSAEAVTNLTMVHDLLHEPEKRLPYDEIDTSLAGLWGEEDKDVHSAPLSAKHLVDPSDLEGLSPDQAIALIRSRAKAVAEGVFWDNVADRLHQSLQVGRSEVWPMTFNAGRGGITGGSFWP